MGFLDGNAGSGHFPGSELTAQKLNIKEIPARREVGVRKDKRQMARKGSTFLSLTS